MTGYTVYRGTAADFTADSSSRLSDVTTASYTDNGRPTGTWYYRVTARDAAGNVSAASSSVSATITPPVVPPVVQSVVTSADTMVAATNAAGTYGTTNQLSSRFSTGIESFMSFTLPAAPAGMQLASASLSLRTSTDSTAASADTHVFHLMSGPWNEATMTWNTRISQTASGVIGELAGAGATNTAYTVTVRAADLAGLLGSDDHDADVEHGRDGQRADLVARGHHRVVSPDADAHVHGGAVERADRREGRLGGRGAREQREVT